jgi:hypothetical protein
LITNNGSDITITVAGVNGTSFDIKQDMPGHDPTPVTGATNGAVISGSTLKAGNNYYIANPHFATGNFEVTLSQG